MWCQWEKVLEGKNGGNPFLGIGGKEWPVEKNKAEKQKEEILASVEANTQTNNKQMRGGWG